MMTVTETRSQVNQQHRGQDLNYIISWCEVQELVYGYLEIPRMAKTSLTAWNILLNSHSIALTFDNLHIKTIVESFLWRRKMYIINRNLLVTFLLPELIFAFPQPQSQSHRRNEDFDTRGLAQIEVLCTYNNRIVKLI